MVEPCVWAKAACLVFDAAHSGSAQAQHIIDTHTLALAKQVALLKARKGDVSTVVCAGGVIVNQSSLFTAFTREVRLPARSVTWWVMTRKRRCCGDPPVKGALNLARQLYPTSQQGMTHSELPATHRIFI